MTFLERMLFDQQVFRYIVITGIGLLAGYVYYRGDLMSAFKWAGLGLLFAIILSSFWRRERRVISYGYENRIEEQVTSMVFSTHMDLWQDKFGAADAEFNEREIINSKTLTNYYKGFNKKRWTVADVTADIAARKVKASSCPQSLAYEIIGYRILGRVEYVVHCFNLDGDYEHSYHIKMDI